jgi:PAS domain S-box-containing protein
MFIDQEKNLWYGTYGMGVSKLTDRKFEIYSKADGLPDNIIWSVVEDINGNIWIGNNFGGVSRLVRREGDIYNTENYKIQNYSTENGFIGDRVNSISSDRSGDLWFCSEEGLSRLSMPIPVYYGKGSRTRRLNFQNYTINTGLDKRRVNAFYEDRYGNKWLAYTGGGVSLINIKGNKLNTIPIGNPVLKTFDTYTIFQDKIGDLWFATNGGVVRCKMNPLTGKIKSFVSITEKDGLLSNDVRSIVQDLDGNLWLGTAAGIVMFNPNDPESKMVTFTSKDGLSSDKITLLVFDENQNLWIGTKEGINKFSTKKYYRIIKKFDEMQGELIESRLEKFKHYGFMEGFTGSETNINAVCKDKEGNLWFGTRRGTMKYVENEDRINKIPPSIRIDGIHVFSERFPAEDKMKLFYDQNYLTVSYIGVSHSIPEKVSYKYMLRGVDRQWQLNGYSRTVNYENLAPGEYTFLVKACNSDGVWAEEPARLDFVIMPPFWSTNWFYIIVGLFVGCMVYLIVLIRLRNLRLMTTELERQVDNKTRELSLSELQYRTLFEKISDSIFIIDKQSHKFLDCNEAVLKVYDYTKEELKEMTPLDLHPEEEHKKAAANIDISTSGRPKSYTHITKSGQVIFVEIASDHIEYNGKDAMISIVRDVTERRRASHEITKMNKELTSSIRYTKRILDSVLKDKKEFSKLFENSFILFKPRGIVSGDFFWYNKVGKKIVVAVIDCTGHGIAGAFMSMVGNGLLNKIVLENNILNPGEILKELHTGVVSALNKEERDSMTLDGMDMGICVIDMQNNTIEASSASRPVILVRDKEYKIIKGKSKLPIGLALGDKRTYKTEKIDYQQGDSIYLLTDGYCDQFGGKEGEKFMSERFLKLLVKIQELSMPNQGVELNNIIEEWKGTREQIDDILVLGFRI